MNQIESIQALSLQDKEKLFSHLGQMIQEEKFYKENEWVRKMEEIKMAVCSAMGIFSYDPTNRKRQNVLVRVITANILLRIGGSELCGQDHEKGSLHYPPLQGDHEHLVGIPRNLQTGN